MLTAQSPHITKQWPAQGRTVCRTDGRTAGRTDGRPDGRSDGWPKSIQKYFSDKKVLSCRTGPGRTAFSVLWTLFPVLSDGSAGCPRAKKYFSKKKVLSPFPYHDCQPCNVFTAAFGPLHLERHAATQVEFSPSGKKANSRLPHS